MFSSVAFGILVYSQLCNCHNYLIPSRVFSSPPKETLYPLIVTLHFLPNDNIFSLSEISLRHGNHVSIGLKMCSEPALPLVSCWLYTRHRTLFSWKNISGFFRGLSIDVLVDIFLMKSYFLGNLGWGSPPLYSSRAVPFFFSLPLFLFELPRKIFSEKSFPWLNKKVWKALG